MKGFGVFVLADFLHPVHTFLLVPLCHVYLGLELAYDVNVACRDASCERGYDDLPSMVFDNPPVDFSDERLGICFPSHILPITFL